ncbi:hypothetical protein RI367_004007 [Sorochytrium milnesiophthora]
MASSPALSTASGSTPLALLYIKCHSARNLRNVELPFRRMDPFVRVQYGALRKETTPNSNGHTAPAWNEELVLSPLNAKRSELWVEVRDREARSTDGKYIGHVKIAIKDMLSGEVKTKADWYQLGDELRKNAGEVYLEFRMEGAENLAAVTDLGISSPALTDGSASPAPGRFQPQKRLSAHSLNGSDPSSPSNGSKSPSFPHISESSAPPPSYYIPPGAQAGVPGTPPIHPQLPHRRNSGNWNAAGQVGAVGSLAASMSQTSLNDNAPVHAARPPRNQSSQLPTGPAPDYNAATAQMPPPPPPHDPPQRQQTAQSGSQPLHADRPARLSSQAPNTGFPSPRPDRLDSARPQPLAQQQQQQQQVYPPQTTAAPERRHSGPMVSPIQVTAPVLPVDFAQPPAAFIQALHSSSTSSSSSSSAASPQVYPPERPQPPQHQQQQQQVYPPERSQTQVSSASSSQHSSAYPPHRTQTQASSSSTSLASVSSQHSSAYPPPQRTQTTASQQMYPPERPQQQQQVYPPERSQQQAYPPERSQSAQQHSQVYPPERTQQQVYPPERPQQLPQVHYPTERAQQEVYPPLKQQQQQQHQVYPPQRPTSNLPQAHQQAYPPERPQQQQVYPPQRPQQQQHPDLQPVYPPRGPSDHVQQQQQQQQQQFQSYQRLQMPGVHVLQGQDTGVVQFAPSPPLPGGQRPPRGASQHHHQDPYSEVEVYEPTYPGY